MIESDREVYDDEDEEDEDDEEEERERESHRKSEVCEVRVKSLSITMPCGNGVAGMRRTYNLDLIRSNPIQFNLHMIGIHSIHSIHSIHHHR